MATMPIAALICRSSIALPVGPHLDVEDMDYIVQAMAEVLREVA